MTGIDVTSKGRWIEKVLLCMFEEYPRYNMNQIYSEVEKVTKSPQSSIRRVKSEYINRLKYHIDILEEDTF